MTCVGKPLDLQDRPYLAIKKLADVDFRVALQFDTNPC